MLGVEEELQAETEVLTEREIRERASFGEIWSVRLPGPGAKVRWPDLVVIREGRATAIELELAAKRSHRLARIIDGYERQTTYERVRFVIDQGAVAERVARIASGWRPGNSPNTVPARRIDIEPWRSSLEFERVERATRAVAESPPQLTLLSPSCASPTNQPFKGEHHE